ncbi:MAG: hypothetical protein KAR38_10045, partial [Calditrichia bacterium]|nr:hypothetical protein [Calditrichia bacterium]
MQIQQNEEYLFTGNIDILNELKKIFVLYSSREIPRQYNKEYDNFYRTLMEQNLVFAGGWHSPLEKEIFNWWKKKKPCPLIYFAS